MRIITILLFTLCVFQVLNSCKSKSSSVEEKAPAASVKATPLVQRDIESEISFTGSTVFYKKNVVVSPISGYIVKTGLKFGEEVAKDEILFEIQTRESKALGSDNTAREVGIIKVPAVSDGFINELNINEPGVFVAEGGILCSIVDHKDLMVKVNVPFEYNSMMVKGRKCKIRLSDNTTMAGSVFRVLPVVNEGNQTQTVLIKPETNRQLPENLNLIVAFVKEVHHQSFVVAKSSLMANETQSEFWIMKIDGNNLAVKIPVQKGIENDTIAEIISPQLKINELIISDGAYGLPDSLQVRIVK
jgi:hypothetical protein